MSHYRVRLMNGTEDIVEADAYSTNDKPLVGANVPDHLRFYRFDGSQRDASLFLGQRQIRVYCIGSWISVEEVEPVRVEDVEPV